MIAAVQLDGRSQPETEEIGLKARGINRMTSLGLPVPPAFVIPISSSLAAIPEKDLMRSRELFNAMSILEARTQRCFGATGNPLLVSVRSGATCSMPGILRTILNVGVNDATHAALQAAYTPEFATAVNAGFRTSYHRACGSTPPQNVYAQLAYSIKAVEASFRSRLAVEYRRARGAATPEGTAVTIQAMVYGNLDRTSGSGIAISQGSRPPIGEWLPGHQGDALAEGRAIPQSLAMLTDFLPVVQRSLRAAANTLEAAFGGPQEIEFTVEQRRFWILQTRPATTAPPQSPFFDSPRTPTVLTGIPASPGVASGIAVTSRAAARAWAAAGRKVVLCRPTTDPHDMPGIVAAVALVTELGGATSHAALISRELGRPCVVGCGPGAVSRIAGREVFVDGEAGSVQILSTPAGFRSDTGPSNVRREVHRGID
ncbi:PEP/pyruvate-binding domain-containing protein [Nocardia sp. NPDC052316]|uniref:PEP/pyruvate-binding domain-containing protein n=1 Tax=Nocardia sp. NPDC052316 TaxID=3364329 RepID=UPI0037CC7D3C